MKHNIYALLAMGLLIMATTSATPTSAAYVAPTVGVLDMVSCPNTDDEYRTGNAQCTFTCSEGNKLSVTASSSDKLDSISGKAECGGAVATCAKVDSDGCTSGNGEFPSYAQNEGACKATGFDPWWHGKYTLTADCDGEGSASDECLRLLKGRCLNGVHLEIIVVDGVVVESVGLVKATGQSFVPVVALEETTDGLAITVST